jgi:hypothetical protein
VIQEFIENQKEHFKQFSPQEVEKATTELSHYFTEELTLLVKLYLSRDFKSLVGKGAIESVDAIIAESNLLLQQNEKLNALRVENFRSSFQRALN